jgi:Zn-dependent M28 family amino/carboxypeptidase
MRRPALACLLLALTMPAMAAEPIADPALVAELTADVAHLGERIGERNTQRYEQLVAARDHILAAFAAAGLPVERQDYQAGGRLCSNVVATVAGRDAGAPLWVVGAHYDTVPGSPGANDNGTGVAALLALARRLRAGELATPLRLVAFVNEEPPFFQTAAMGSMVYAKSLAARGERVAGMISLETIGCFSDQPHSQRFPHPALGELYPDTGNFVAIVGNEANRPLVDRLHAAFSASGCGMPSEAFAGPEALPGVGWSDHWAFWQHGFPAVMITDTAPFRDDHYHTAGDTPAHVDHARLAQVVVGVHAALRVLAGP